ncbi:hypothetical protein FB451DRAFT_1173672 [Mycena latifolia]|nr:hypothetical protein FB451DRAFT_1173672 [Mycena latifolia]
MSANHPQNSPSPTTRSASAIMRRNTSTMRGQKWSAADHFEYSGWSRNLDTTQSEARERMRSTTGILQAALRRPRAPKKYRKKRTSAARLTWTTDKREEAQGSGQETLTRCLPPGRPRKEEVEGAGEALVTHVEVAGLVFHAVKIHISYGFNSMQHLAVAMPPDPRSEIMRWRCLRDHDAINKQASFLTLLFALMPYDPPFFPNLYNYVDDAEHDSNARKFWFLVLGRGLFTLKSDADAEYDKDNILIFFSCAQTTRCWITFCNGNGMATPPWRKSALAPWSLAAKHGVSVKQECGASVKQEHGASVKHKDRAVEWEALSLYLDMEDSPPPSPSLPSLKVTLFRNDSPPAQVLKCFGIAS